MNVYVGLLFVTLFRVSSVEREEVCEADSLACLSDRVLGSPENVLLLQAQLHFGESSRVGQAQKVDSQVEIPQWLSVLVYGVVVVPLNTPINSAGSHNDHVKVVDVLLLFLFVSIPFQLYFLIRAYDKWNSRQQWESEQDEDADTLPQRLGSSYRLEPNQQELKLLSALSMQSDGDDKEGTVLQNVLAGFSTAMAALPDAISFSFITGVSPLNGIWAGVFMALSAALVGGRPGMISSASAATAVVLKDISLEYGLGPMALTVFVVGVLQIVAGILRLSRFITLIPHSVMLGFVNGLAIVMIRAQLRQFHEAGDGPWLERELILGISVTALVAMVAAVAWNRIPHANKLLPAPLASTIVTVCFSLAFQNVLPRRTLKDVAGAETFAGGLTSMPPWDFPPQGVNWEDRQMLMQVFFCAARFAVVGLLESLMTEALIDQITGTAGSMRRECFGQGVGNLLSSFFGTQGGCALIAQSLLNVSSGGLGRISGVTMGLTLFLSVVCAARLMGEVPVAVFVGLIILIALNTFAWGSLELLTRINWVDAIVVIVVTAVTVWKDLAIAVLSGVVICGLGFAWIESTHVRIVSHSHGRQRIFVLHGPLFFGSAMNFQTSILPRNIEEEVVVLDFSCSRILDISGTEAICQVCKNIKDARKQVVLRGVPEDVLALIPDPDVPAMQPSHKSCIIPSGESSTASCSDALSSGENEDPQDDRRRSLFPRGFGSA